MQMNKIMTIKLSVLLLFILAMFISVVTLEFFEVYGNSMSPTIINGNKLVVKREHLRLSRITRFGVYVIENEGVRMVKRCIGIPGDFVQISDSTIIVNKEDLLMDCCLFSLNYDVNVLTRDFDFSLFSSPPKIVSKKDTLVMFNTTSCMIEKLEKSGAIRVRRKSIISTAPSLGKGKSFLIDDGEYFFIGDNLPNSIDSRQFGTIKRNRIVGKVLRYD